MKHPGLLICAMLAACGTPTPRPVTERSDSAPPAVVPASTFQAEPRKSSNNSFKPLGGFYKDDGPGENAPEDFDAIPDAIPRIEPLHRFANNPYTVLGRDYVPQKNAQPYRAQGIGSWYGRKFHGQKTSSGEIYDMYAMTAAHPTLPIPSYVRVTNPANRKSVVVRVNDRGPFLHGRLIDLSFTAAWKLGYVNQGSSPVIVERLLPGQASPLDSVPAPDDDPIARLALSETITPPPATLLPATLDSGGHYLQLGAFGNRDNADALRARLARELGELADKLLIRSSGALHRVQLGPWADADAARRAAESLRQLERVSVILPR